MQQRYYDPRVGRFWSVDPVTAFDTGDMRLFNRYAYGYNNPYRFTDPDGRESSAIRAMERDHKAFLRGEMSEDQLREHRNARGMGAAAAGAVVAVGVVAIESGAVAATVNAAGKVADAAGKATVAADSAYTSGGLAVYAKGKEVAQVAVTQATSSAAAVAGKTNELVATAMASPIGIKAVKHLDKIVDAIEGYMVPGPPPMTPAGAVGSYASYAEKEVEL